MQLTTGSVTLLDAVHVGGIDAQLRVCVAYRVSTGHLVPVAIELWHDDGSPDGKTAVYTPAKDKDEKFEKPQARDSPTPTCAAISASLC